LASLFLCIRFDVILYKRSVKQLKLAEKKVEELGLAKDNSQEISAQKQSA